MIFAPSFVVRYLSQFLGVIVQLRNYSHDCLKTGPALFEDVVRGWARRVRDHGTGFPPDLFAVLHTSGPQRFRTPCRGPGPAWT
ncbi:hypothetical protein [Streptomyces canus]|uniref:hypothetical protein n=1 Tax=Streptomyces canus TaxID=58343 RepID=UPI0030DF87CC